MSNSHISVKNGGFIGVCVTGLILFQYKAPRPKLKEGSTAAHQRALHDAARETSGRTPPRTGEAH